MKVKNLLFLFYVYFTRLYKKPVFTIARLFPLVINFWYVLKLDKLSGNLCYSTEVEFYICYSADYFMIFCKQPDWSDLSNILLAIVKSQKICQTKILFEQSSATDLSIIAIRNVPLWRQESTVFGGNKNHKLRKINLKIGNLNHLKGSGQNECLFAYF